MDSPKPNQRNVPPSILGTCIFVAALGPPAPGIAQTVDFERDIWPIIEFRCIECHGPDKQREDLRFDDLEWLSDEELLGDGDASRSLIFELLSLPPGDEDRMPKKRDPMTPDEIDLIRRWLNDGAPSGGWEVPDVVVAKRSGGELDDVNRLAQLAEGVGPAPKDAVQALRARGALVLPLAANTHLLQVDFKLAEEIAGDEDLKLLKPLAGHITWLVLARTDVTDAGLDAVAGMSRLTRLDLGYTAVGDPGMAHLAKLANLEYLNLVNTQVGDAGLEQLTGLSNLRKLFLWRSKATAEGVRALETAIPGLNVNLGLAITPSTE